MKRSIVLDRARSTFRQIPLWSALLGMVMVQPALASNPKIRVTVGQSVTQYCAAPIKTLSLADSKIADVVVANTHEILVNGKAIGFTTVVVWDENNRSTIYDVVVRGPFSDEQIELQVKVAEINRTKAMEYGIDMLFQDKSSTAGSYTGGVATPSVPLEIFKGGSGTDNVTMALRYVSGTHDLQAMIHALEENGVLRVLAQPNVVAMSGQTARFLSGGEIPVPIATAGAQGGSTITIEWKEFGVKVEFLPTIVDSGVVNLMVAPEVSSIDFANGIVLSGFRVPALRTRRAATTVELKDGEVLVIGGLMVTEEISRRQGIPLLMHVPLVNFFFSRTVKTQNQSELLLVVSPRLVRAFAKGTEVPLPTDLPTSPHYTPGEEPQGQLGSTPDPRMGSTNPAPQGANENTAAAAPDALPATVNAPATTPAQTTVKAPAP